MGFDETIHCDFLRRHRWSQEGGNKKTINQYLFQKPDFFNFLGTEQLEPLDSAISRRQKQNINKTTTVTKDGDEDASPIVVGMGFKEPIRTDLLLGHQGRQEGGFGELEGGSARVALLGLSGRLRRCHRPDDYPATPQLSSTKTWRDGRERRRRKIGEWRWKWEDQWSGIGCRKGIICCDGPHHDSAAREFYAILFLFGIARKHFLFSFSPIERARKWMTAEATSVDNTSGDAFVCV